MDGATYAPFLRHSWFQFRVTGNVAGRPLSFHMRSCFHAISLTVRGRAAVRWMSRGREKRWEESVGTVNFTPFDGEDHAFLTAMSPDFESAVFFIPKGHLGACLVSEECEPPGEFRRILRRDDPVLQSCLVRLAESGRPDDAADLRKDEAARKLVLRLTELGGGSMPAWRNEESVFAGRTVGDLVMYIDEHLRISPRLEDMAMLVGLSPSHFAKKFRQSMGLSLHRFVNRRRVNRSLDMLKTGSDSLGSIALDLGFASQSHFTSVFSHLTGMTPAKYRSGFRRAVA